MDTNQQLVEAITKLAGVLDSRLQEINGTLGGIESILFNIQEALAPSEPKTNDEMPCICDKIEDVASVLRGIEQSLDARN
jgi:hypothetical protein